MFNADALPHLTELCSYMHQSRWFVIALLFGLGGFLDLERRPFPYHVFEQISHHCCVFSFVAIRSS